MRKDASTRRHKTIRDNIMPSNAAKGDTVKIVGGAFAGWAGKVVDIDGIWLTVESPAPSHV